MTEPIEAAPNPDLLDPASVAPGEHLWICNVVYRVTPDKDGQLIMHPDQVAEYHFGCSLCLVEFGPLMAGEPCPGAAEDPIEQMQREMRAQGVDLRVLGRDDIPDGLVPQPQESPE